MSTNAWWTPSFRIHNLCILFYDSRILSEARMREVKEDVKYLVLASCILGW
jgi:hypothetical protein